MTLLTIAQSILKETKDSSIPTIIIGNTQDSAVQVLQALKVSIVEVSRSYDWQQLQKEKTFTAVASTEGYDLPTDFDRFVNETFWNSSQTREVIGPTGPIDWRVLKNSTISGGAFYEYFRIRGSQTLIFPTPTTTDSYIYEYVTNLVVNSSGDVGQTGWLADTDVPAIDDHIITLDGIWRFLKMNGRPYDEEQKTANSAIAERARVNGARKTIRHNYYNRNVRVGYPSTISAP
jgi:hypothetical protein